MPRGGGHDLRADFGLVQFLNFCHLPSSSLAATTTQTKGTNSTNLHNNLNNCLQVCRITAKFIFISDCLILLQGLGKDVRFKEDPRSIVHQFDFHGYAYFSHPSALGTIIPLRIQGQRKFGRFGQPPYLDSGY
eukprot:TRINITY_DN2440_c1_g1_i1.p17 TRINITY_DN2440_c1_g1~~TRINITY_DN2440_c1_g1_i1.p17  ORF type:complete len:152 (+),score=0.11 TRINITY_DN2440_c1_g1_i1:60-458(+)